MILSMRYLIPYAKGNFMHKLLYTAAIPLLVGGAMAATFEDTVVREETGSNASSRATSPAVVQNNDVQSGIFSFDPTAEIPSMGMSDQVNDTSSALVSLAIADATQTYTIPNLATTIPEEEAAHVGGTINITTSLADVMQPRRLFINEGGTGRVLFQIAPDSHLEGSARAPKSFDEIRVAGDADLTVDFIPTAGDYEVGEYTYVLAKIYAGVNPTINADSGVFSARAEQVTTEEGLVQLLLKLTVTEAFTITETDEENEDDMPPLVEEILVANNADSSLNENADNESSEEDDFGDYQEPDTQASVVAPVVGAGSIVQEEPDAV